MSFKILKDDMIVRNNIIIEPTINYISASYLCDDFIGHGISSSGVYGEVPVLNTQNKYSSLQSSPSVSLSEGTRVYDVSYLNTVSDDLINIVNVINDARETDDFETALKEKGVFFNNKFTFKHGIEKVKQKYLIDDENYYKKKSIKNLLKFYNENKTLYQTNCNWGFSNYNTINFFNIDETLNENIVYKTHSNCLAYENLVTNNTPTYNFTSNNLTFSFYINQRRKSRKNFQFNPGCIISIPKLISIYIVKGTNVDINGLTDQYRILIETGNKTLSSLVSNAADIDFNNTNAQSNNDNSVFLSSDNIIKHNHWHNITLTLVNISNNNYFLNIYNDGKLIDNFSVILDKSQVNSEDSFVLIGNKFSNISGNISNYVNEFFSINGEVADDAAGPYSVKSISKNKNSKIITAINNNFVTQLNDTVEIVNTDYISQNTSLALNAEIHDIRIYNYDAGIHIDQTICKNSVDDFLDDELIFCIPVYYYDNIVQKKSLVNLNNFTFDDIPLSNLHIEGPVNYYFSNKSLGHEVCVENFLYEFKQKTSPNIIFGNNTKKEEIHKTFLLLSKNENVSDSTSFICDKIAKGNDILSIYNEKIKNLTLDDVNQSYFDNLQKNNFYYRNNMILPNDNGLQFQNYNANGYYENYSGNSHLKNEVFDYQHVNLNNIHTSLSSYKTLDSLIENIKNKDLMDFASNSGFLQNDPNRRDFFVVDNRNKKFKENYDNFKNSSLNIFHGGIVLNNEDNNMYFKSNNYSGSNNNLIDFGRNSFLKDLSNPVSRKINSDYSNAIADFLAPIGKKILDPDPANPDDVVYYAHELPLFNMLNDVSETFTNIFCISTNLFKKSLIRETINIKDTSLGGTGRTLNINLTDNGYGNLYRNDCMTPRAEWNYVGHVLYKEGILTVLHPGIENFSSTNYSIEFKANTTLNVFELNLPSKAGEVNLSRNSSYIENLKVNDSAFNSDEDFVYITDIDLHDDNLNVLASAKLANPFPKKNTDNVLFRLKMDF